MENLLVQYVTDSEGNKTAVLVPIEQWDQILKEIQELKTSADLKGKLSSGFNQMLQIKRDELSRNTLTDFLDEC
ncbi:MAG: hypothetical protein AAFY70_07585 [Bacteroidota bacterium]